MKNLANHNKLVQQPSGVWCPDHDLPGSSFEYSDGEEVENFIKKTVAQAKDLSSLSQELDREIVDWASEYHLSSVRANLLRGLDLSNISTALELGCGCGAISRYLGELGIEVDAIEGSLRRAETARLRCKELDNISVINQNFNDLRFPGKNYDSVFFIGVLEYAKKFCPSAASDRDALLRILDSAQSVLTDQGTVVIAIENRIGLKYLMGAGEDHYGVPNIGLCKYPEIDGTRTYDIDEWKEILHESGFNSWQFLFPFPDYKLPYAVLSEHFLKKYSNAHSVLYGMRSRDYQRELVSDIDEFLFWKVFHQTQEITKFSNSYLIVAGNDKAIVDRITPFDFVHFSNPTRKNQFRNITRKGHEQSLVTKDLLFDNNEITKEIRQLRDADNYRTGQLLAEVWCQDLQIHCVLDKWDNRIKQYYSFLVDYDREHGQDNNIVDVLPTNILINDQGNFDIIDKEWQLDEQVSPEFVLLRAIYFFLTHNKLLTNKLFQKYRFQNIQIFLLYCLDKLGLDPEFHYRNFIDTENRVQDLIHAYRTGEPLEATLVADMDFGNSGTNFSPAVYWAKDGENFNETKIDTKPLIEGSGPHSLTFTLPARVANASRLRFDPMENQGCFRIFSLTLDIVDKRGSIIKHIFNCNNGTDIVNAARLEGVSHHLFSKDEIFVSRNQDPQFVFKLPNDIEAPQDGSLRFIITIDFIKPLNNTVLLSEFLNRENSMLGIIDAKQKEIRQLQLLKEELVGIKESRLWKVFDKLQQIIGKAQH